jgi:nucleoside phosphorylase
MTPPHRADQDPVPRYRALIVTALPVECRAVREHLSAAREFVTSLGMVGELGTFGPEAAPWSVGVIQVGMGNERAAVETERAIAELDPQVVLFVGVAGGIKDVALGDVLVASKVYAYEYGKDSQDFRSRPEALEPSYRILSRASAVARNDGWRLRIRPTPEGNVPHRPTAVVKPMAAGSKVVGDTRSTSANLLREHFSDAAAVEMEGHGFLRALQAHPERQALVVRGISDLIDGKEASDAGGWQAIASATAAAFAFEVLAQLVIPGAAKEAARMVDPSREGDVWRALHALLVRLYPAGPLEDRVWQRAGGDPSRLPSGTTPRTAWYDAVTLLQRGGGGASVASLLHEAGQDYPLDVELIRLGEAAER